MSFFGGGFPFGGMPGFGGFEQESGPQEPVDNDRYYQLLGVDKNIDSADVKKVFRKLAMKKHPDKGGDPNEFAELSQAAEVLSDPEKRKIYDRFGEKGIKEGMGSGGPEGMSIFDLLSGRVPNQGQARGPKKCDDTLYPLPVTLEDLFNGKVRKIAINRNRNCTDCRGEGGSKAQDCRDCRGKGRVMKMQQIGPGMYTQSVGTCETCNGEGRIVDPKFRCKKCKGKRVLEEKKVIEVQIDKGAPNKHRYNFHGESDEAPGFQPGDLVVEIQEKEHEVFKRKKADLMMEKKITLMEALTGYKFTITHLDGSTHLIQSAPGEVVKPGDIKTVEDLGMPLFKLTYKNGNLFIRFDVEFPAPATLQPSACEALRQVLPPPDPSTMEIDPSGFDRANTHLTINFEKAHVTENNTKTYSDHAHEEEEDDPRMMGGRQVRCSGTIF